MDAFENLKKRAEELRAELNRHARLYYEDDAPEISDFQYDELMRELQDIEGKYPELAEPDSPTQRIGGAPREGFVKVAHAEPMMSLENALNRDELAEFYTKLGESLSDANPAVLCEPKIDGLAVSLVYENGLFVQPQDDKDDAAAPRSGGRRNARGARRGLHRQKGLRSAQRRARGKPRAALREPAQRRGGQPAHARPEGDGAAQS